MTYLEKINKLNSIEDLKTIAKTVFNNNKIKTETKKKIASAYHEKRRELYRQYANESSNKLFKNLLFQVNTIARRPHEISSLGKYIYDNRDKFNKIERDILFRSYKFQKKQTKNEKL